jgi:PAS domain S-box-containing protein
MDSYQRYFLSRDSLLQILDNHPDAIFATDKQGRISYFNKKAERITGISSQKALGMYCSQLFQDNTCQYQCPVKKDQLQEQNQHELIIIKASGARISVLCFMTPLRDEDGIIVGGINVFRDISEQKRLEKDLQYSENKYQYIFEGSKDMIFLFSTKGTVQDVNQAGIELLGFRDKSEMLSLESVEKIFYKPVHWKVFKKQLDLYGYVRDFEANFQRKDGVSLHCLISGNAISEDSGRVIGYEGVVKDITARMDADQILKRRHRELMLLNSVALCLNMGSDLRSVLKTVLKKVLQALHLYSGAIFLLDPEKQSFFMDVHHGFPKLIDKNYRLVFHDQVLYRYLLKNEHHLQPMPNYPPFKISLQDARGISLARLTCFLITTKEKASGFFAFYISDQRQLSDQDVHIMGSLGNFLGGAIENARLLHTIHKHREELKGVTAKLFHSQETERRRIARELHDEVGQALTGINFSLEDIEKRLTDDYSELKDQLWSIKKHIKDTYQELRSISYNLHPSLLSDLGLEAALETYLQNCAKQTGLDIDFQMIGFEERIDPNIEIAFYRLTQEVLTNTIRHAQATKFKLSLIKSFPHLIFVAEDNGQGFDPNTLDRHREALGLLSMRERAAMLNGSFSLQTSEGQGTRIRIEIPIREYTHV